MAQAQRDWYGRLVGFSEKECGRHAQRASHILFRRWLVGIGISLATGMGVFGELPGDAQSITLDGSLGPIRSLGNGPVYVIQPGDGRTSGTNLFHSFNRFNLNQGEQANFQTTAAIQNILVRVTGGSASSIDGVLSTNNNANLFFLNPAGILLGRNARLQIGGSFIASTADSFVFADGTQFSAIAPQASPLLSISTPIGLQFGHQPGRIQVLGNGRGIRRNTDPVITPNQAALRVPSNRTLVLLGGPLEIVGGTLKTAGGRIELGSVAGAGFVGLSPVDRGFAVNYGQITNFGDIHLSSVAAIDASGLRGGDIQIRGRQISLREGSQVESSTLGNEAGGTLTIAAEQVILEGSTADNPGDDRLFPTSISADNRGTGQDPAAINITTRHLSVTRGARISASNTGTGFGTGGDIWIQASESVALIGTGRSQGGLRSSGISVQNRSAGKAGTLTINTRRLLVRDGAEASAATFGDGDGGTLTINATERVEVMGKSADGQRRSGLLAGVGNPAEILSVAPPAPVFAEGKGGDLTINTGSLLVSDGGVVEVSSRSGTGGAQGAGSLVVNASSLRLQNEGAIVAETDSGQRGNITLNLDQALVMGNGGLISATAGRARGAGDGGNITIAAPLVISLPGENNDIIANAFSGTGGNITINAQAILNFTLNEQEQAFEQLRRQLTNDISASSDLGSDGTLSLTGLNVDPAQGIAQLPTDPRTPQPVQGCDTTHANSQPTQAEFFTSGRGGLPPSPNRPLSSADILDDLRLPPSLKTSSESAILEANRWYVDAQGHVVLTADVAIAPTTSHCRL